MQLSPALCAWCEVSSVAGQPELCQHAAVRLVGKGQPAFIISPHCRVLIKAFETGYQYKQLNVAGATKYTDQPDKNQYSHPADASQYLCLGAMPERDRKQTITSNATRAAQRAADSVTGY